MDGIGIKKDDRRIAVVGGGASGLFFAYRASQLGCNVAVFEKNEKCGRKLAITGKGRCNLTNNCPINEFIENIVSNKRFLYGAANALPPQKVMEIFEDELNVPLKTERGNRVFPISDKAGDIVYALVKGCERNGVRFIRDKVTDIESHDGKVCGIHCGTKKYSFDSVVIATGGKSYPLTGSDGSGYQLAEKLGLKVTGISPSLVPLVTRERDVCEMMGLSLKNVRLSVRDNQTGKIVFSDFGEMIFTHFGISGPIVLSASAHMRPMSSGRFSVMIDLKSALDEKTLDARILSDFSKFKNCDFINSLKELLPSKMIPVFVKRCSIPPNKKVNSITKAERQRIVGLFKKFEFTIEGTRPIAEAIITSGGVDLSQIDPKSMECKAIKNLYFIGEVLDLDAYTGGFNLQIAFCTANIAALDVAKKMADHQ